MFSLPGFFVLFVQLTHALVIDKLPDLARPDDQRVLASVANRPRHEYVPGGSPASYVGSPDYQLFKIDYMKIMPHPVQVDEIFFVYIMGELGDYPDLLDTNLKLVCKNYTTNGGPVIEPGRLTFEAPLDTNHWHSLAIRRTLSVNGPPGRNMDYLVPGRIELVVDWVFIDLEFIQQDDFPMVVIFEAHATLPDGRTVFHFEAPVEIVKGSK